MKKDSEPKLFPELKRLAKTSFAIIGDIFELACLELQLAQKSLAAMVYVFFLLLVVSVGLWLGINALLVVYFISIGLTLMGALVAIISVNILLGIILSILLIKFASTITLSATRHQLRIHTEDGI
jgi:uncharacterized membrane protein YqjE